MGGDVAHDLSAPAEFRVRFTRARGLAGLFEPPSNSYRWSGQGSLRVEPSGMHLHGTRRSVLGILRREQRFVPRPQITHVYREADAVSIDFRAGARKGHLSFWAGNSSLAVDIVGQLPSVCTVELDAAAKRGPPVRRVPRPLIVVCVMAVLLLAATAAWVRLHAVVGRTLPVVRAPAVVPQAPVTARLSDAVRPPRVSAATAGADWVVTPGADALEDPKDEPELAPALDALPPTWFNGPPRDIEIFRLRREANHLLLQSRSKLGALDEGRESREVVLEQVEGELLPRWTSLSERLRALHPEAVDDDERLRVGLLAVARNWESALARYDEGLRLGEPVSIAGLLREVNQ